MIADEQNTDPVDHPRRPKRVSLQRVSKGNIYKYVLHEVSVGRKKTENGCADTDISPESGNEQKASTETAISKTETSSDTGHSASVAPDRPHSAFYADEVADILMRPKTQDDKESKKKANK